MRHAALIGLVIGSSLSAAIAQAPTTRPAAVAPVPANTPAKKPAEVNFREAALTDAIDFFRTVTGANIVVEWKALEEIGVSRDTPVNLNLKRVKFRVALKATLESASPGLLAYYIDNGVIHITTLARADAQMITRVYPVQDLLHDIPDFKTPNQNNSNDTGTEVTVGGDSGSGGGSGSGSGLGNSGGNETEERTTKTRKERAQDLIDIIQTTIRADVWDINGGKARIRHLNGNLVITAPRSVHEQIGIGY
ncbi:MAG: hypothetical protein H7144_08090 [Burkholderiales bacterium]|nr:hypothetical protein [Phycisphaerae bacterium]